MQQPSDAFLDPRKITYLNSEGADRPLKSPIDHDVLLSARRYRLARIREQLLAFDGAAILLYDPGQYSLRAGCLQHAAVDLARGHPLRAHLCRKTCCHGGGNKRLAIDKVEPPGMAALQAKGLVYVEGQHMTALARAIKNEQELTLMRWTIRVCEAAMARIYANSVPGRSEQELWAELHYENARSGGEWLETCLFTCDPRSNSWYQECSDYICQRGEMISFDTDMVGPYGYCADLSRSWT
jgi:Xaa-Pro dipeptidase